MLELELNTQREGARQGVFVPCELGVPQLEGAPYGEVVAVDVHAAELERVAYLEGLEADEVTVVHPVCAGYQVVGLVGRGQAQTGVLRVRVGVVLTPCVVGYVLQHVAVVVTEDLDIACDDGTLGRTVEEDAQIPVLPLEVESQTVLYARQLAVGRCKYVIWNFLLS